MNPALILVGIALFTWGIGEGMFFYFVPIYLEQLGANPLTIGSVFGTFALVMMAAHIPAGYLSDRLGRRPLLRAAWLMGLAATWIMALANNLSIFVVGYLLYGVTAFVSSPLFSYVTAASGKLTAGRAMTLTSAMFNLGMVIGPLAGGWIGGQYSLRLIFSVSASFFVVSTVLMFLLRPQPRDEHDGGSATGKLWANPRFLMLLGVIFLTMFASYLPQPLTPNFLQNQRGVSITQMGWIGSAGSLGNVAFNLLLGQLEARIGFILGHVCVAFFAVLLWRGDALPWYAAGYFLLGGFRAARMLSMAQVRLLVHRAQMGLAYGITEAVSSLALILAPLLAGYLYDRDPASVYPLGLLLITIGVMISLIFIPREKRQAVKETV